MITEAGRALLQSDIETLQRQGSRYGFEVELQGSVVVARLRARDGRTYALRLQCDGYPVEPPSVRFVDPDTLAEEVPGAWPNDGNQFFKPHYQPNLPLICIPGTREYALTHSGAQYDPRSNRIGPIIHAVRQRLMGPQYQGGYK